MVWFGDTPFLSTKNSHETDQVEPNPLPESLPKSFARICKINKTFKSPKIEGKVTFKLSDLSELIIVKNSKKFTGDMENCY